MKFFRIFITAIIVVAALAYINIVLLPQPKQAQANVTAYYDSDVCGQLKVLDPTPGKDITESPSCTAGGIATSHVNDYQTTVTVYNSSDHDITGNFGWDEYWCNYDSGNSCGGAGNPKETTYNRTNGPSTIPSHKSVTFKSSDNHPVGDGFSYCGVYQHDFTFSYQDSKTKQSCNPGNPKTGKSFYTMDWGVCRAGTGTDAKCYPAPTPTPVPQYHNICDNFACKQVPGPGQSQCNTVTNNDVSPECSHLTCINNSCERVPQPGNNTCQPEGSSCGQTHMDCLDNTCRIVPGPGQDTCSRPGSYCGPQKHLGCVNNACVWVPGVGNPQCTQSPDSCAVAHLTVIKVVNNNHGGTKKPGDFTLRVNGQQVTNNVTYAEQPGDYVVSEDSMDGYHQVSNSCGDGHIHLDPGENRACIIMNEDNGTTACQMPTCNTSISGCSYPYPDTTTCSCGPMVCVTQTPSQPNVTINNNNNPTINVSQQQQQQQAVLAASVQPASTATSLPSTGAGAEVLLSLFGLLPIGWKLRKLV